jgi:hypothetical protein
MDNIPINGGFELESIPFAANFMLGTWRGIGGSREGIGPM